MPRNVRNFWIEIDVDGKKERIATGPVARDGGFSLMVKMRDNGGIMTAAVINGFARDGAIRLEIQPMGHPEIEITTVR